MKRTPGSLTLRFPRVLRERMDYLGELAGHDSARDIIVAALQMYEHLVEQHVAGDVNFFQQKSGGPLAPLEFPTGLVFELESDDD